MIPELLIAAGSVLGAGGFGWLGYSIRNSWGKNPDPAAPRPPKSIEDMSLAEVMQRGQKVIAQMARDVHGLYHPPDENGNPCKCAYCEIRADDEPDEPEPEPPKPEPPKPVVKKKKPASKIVRAVNRSGDYDDCATHRKGGCVCKDEGMAPCPPPQSVYQSEKARWEKQVKNLENQLKELGDAYQKLKMGQREKIVTKTVERKSVLEQQIEQCAKFADEGQEPVKLNVETQGRAIEVIVSPQRPPDMELEQWGESETIKRWNTKPATVTHTKPFKRRPDETDREAMQRLGRESRAAIDGPVPGYYSTPNGDGSYTMHMKPVKAEFRPGAQF